jgi:hypothetical protein
MAKSQRLLILIGNLTTFKNVKYLPTLDLWNPAISAAIRLGNLKLQTGQWVRCGQSQPSRFVAARAGGRSLWVAHPEGTKGTRESFNRLLKANASTQ